jgi:hypothetical protein
VHMASASADERSHQSLHGGGEERGNGDIEEAEAITGAVLAPTRCMSCGGGVLHHGNGAVVLPLWS